MGFEPAPFWVDIVGSIPQCGKLEASVYGSDWQAANFFKTLNPRETSDAVRFFTFYKIT